MPNSISQCLDSSSLERDEAFVDASNAAFNFFRDIDSFRNCGASKTKIRPNFALRICYKIGRGGRNV